MNNKWRKYLSLSPLFLTLALVLLGLPYPTGTHIVVERERLVQVPVSVWVVERGLASWYAEPFHGRRTASGEVYSKYAWVMAARHLPLGTFARVGFNGRECIVRVVDRGPYVPGRSYDLSEAVARYLGIVEQGVAEVEVAVLRDRPPSTEGK